MIKFLLTDEALYQEPYPVPLPRHNATKRHSYTGSEDRLVVWLELLYNYTNEQGVVVNQQVVGRELEFHGFPLEATEFLAAAVLEYALNRDYRPLTNLLTPEKEEHHDPAQH